VATSARQRGCRCHKNEMPTSPSARRQPKDQACRIDSGTGSAGIFGGPPPQGARRRKERTVAVGCQADWRRTSSPPASPPERASCFPLTSSSSSRLERPAPNRSATLVRHLSWPIRTTSRWAALITLSGDWQNGPASFVPIRCYARTKWRKSRHFTTCTLMFREMPQQASVVLRAARARLSPSSKRAPRSIPSARTRSAAAARADVR